MSIFDDYKNQKGDILIKSNNLLTALANKRALDVSKIKNRVATGSGGSNEDLRYFTENSLNSQEQEVLNNKDDEIEALQEKALSTAKANAVAKRKQDLAMFKNVASAFSKIF